MKDVKIGALVAAAAATLVMSGPVTAGEGAKTDKVHCYGVTTCKGTSDCKTATNSCHGQNSCKGQGFKTMTADECKAAGGTTEEKK